MNSPSKIQTQAMMHLHGPAEIIAGPGSGKTFTIIHRILYLINQCHISPEKILVITYTQSAAREMKERYRREIKNLSVTLSSSVIFGTFHSVCYHILQQSGVIGPSSLIKENDRRRLLQSILNHYELSSANDYDTVSLLLDTISKKKNGAKTEVTICTGISEEDFQKIRNAYDSYLHEQRKIDFDDMITECLKLLRENTAIRMKYQQQFSYILADEFQDINFPQYQILKLLALPENNLFVVGDDDQAIYGFRGATPGIMKQFTADFDGCCQIMLTENYRSKSEIVNLAEKVIKENTERFEKQFYPINNGGQIQKLCFENRKEEERYLIQTLKALPQQELNQTAIILRTNLDAFQYREACHEAHIPVKGNVSVPNKYQNFILSDFIAFISYLYLGHRRSDFLCFMNKPDRFLLREAFPYETIDRKQVMSYYRKNNSMLISLKYLFSTLELAEKISPNLAIALFRHNLGYDDYLIGKASGTEEKKRYLKLADDLQALFKTYIPGTDPKEFMKSITEKEACSNKTQELNGVSVITMHASKGLEFNNVYLPDVNEGIIPGKKCLTMEALEEERRLLYVAITRARNTLSIYYTKERGRKLSRFLEGIILPHP